MDNCQLGVMDVDIGSCMVAEVGSCLVVKNGCVLAKMILFPGFLCCYKLLEED